MSYLLSTYAQPLSTLPVNTFSSLNSVVGKLFDLSIVEVSLNTLLFPIAHTLFAVPCNLLINKKGIRISYYVSAGLVVLGVWLRTFLTEGNPYICLLGSMISAIGGIFIFNTPSRIALNWFRAESISYVTFFGVLANLVSNALGLTIPGLVINANSTQEEVIEFLRLEAIIITIPFILMVIFIREKPKNAPSKAALAFTTAQPGRYVDILKAIFSNKEYLKLCASMSLNFGICIGYLAVLEQSLFILGFPNASRSISFCGASGIVVGVFANVVYSYYIKKTQKYKRTLIIATLGDFIGLVIWTVGFFLFLDSWWELILLSALFCFNHFSLPSIYVLFSTEIAFPIDQASAAGYMIAVSQTVGFLSGLLFAYILDVDRRFARIIFYITLGCLFISFLISLTVKEDLRRARF